MTNHTSKPKPKSKPVYSGKPPSKLNRGEIATLVHVATGASVTGRVIYGVETGCVLRRLDPYGNKMLLGSVYTSDEEWMVLQ